MSTPLQNIGSLNKITEAFSKLERELDGPASNKAKKRFKDLGFPTKKDESWRYSNISPYLKRDYNFVLANEKSISKPVDQLLEPSIYALSKGAMLVFINGYFSPERSDISLIKNDIIILSLKEAFDKYGEIISETFAQQVENESEVFTSMNTAYSKDGLFLYVPEGNVVKEPVHVLYLTDPDSQGIFSQPRTLLVADKNSHVKLVEHYYDSSHANGFTNQVSEIAVFENANVEHYKLQMDAENVTTSISESVFVSATKVNQKLKSQYTNYTFSFNGAFIRNNLHLSLDEEYIGTDLYGLFIGMDDQLIDNYIIMDHKMPNCRSNEFYKGIMGGKSTGIFNGKIIVRKDAQHTNAFQSNKNILVSDKATINSKPQLEIFADDVKCSHGATSGQIDEDALFYIMSRGIAEKPAMAMLLEAFANDVIKHVNIKELRSYLEQATTRRLSMISN